MAYDGENLESVSGPTEKLLAGRQQEDGADDELQQAPPERQGPVAQVWTIALGKLDSETAAKHQDDVTRNCKHAPPANNKIIQLEQ